MIKDSKLSDVVGTLQRLTSAIFSDAIQRKLILDNLTEGVFTVDLDLKITSFNKAAEGITSIREEEALGRPCTELFHSLTGEDFCIIGRVVEERQPRVKRTRHLQVGDRLIPVMVSASPLTDNNGTVVGGVQSFQEITEIFQRQLILDSLFDGVFTVDLDSKITLFNRAAEQLTGFKQEEVLGRSVEEVLSPRPATAAEPTTTLSRAIATGRPVIEELVYFEIADRRLLPVSVLATPLRDRTGRIIGGVANFRDSTGRLQTNLILDHVADGVVTLDKGARITSFNRASARITGYASEEALGRPCEEIFSGNVCQFTKAEGTIHGSQAEAWINKNIYLKGRGDKIVPVNITSVPIVDVQGNALAVVQTFRDITRELQSQFILDSVADGVFTVDQDLNILSFNRSAEKITGYTSEEAVGKKCGEIFCAEVCGSPDCPMARALDAKTRVIVRHINIHDKNGNKVPISISATAMVDDDGKIVGGVETFRDLTEITRLRSQVLDQSERCGITSKSEKMNRILSVLPEFAKSDSNVVILGESGTGKELIASAIHQLSDRENYPFVAVNSGALPDTLLESELFGYKAGAFTDAKRDKKGRFAAAEKGTLFLDEIGDISLAMQVKLLRVLQTKQYEPLGSNVPTKTDVRIIAATNRNLEEMVRNGTFREDLFYRLNVIKIELPPLRERMEDVAPLVERFIQKFNSQRGRHVRGVSEDAMVLLMRHDYPGNIRELENIIEYAFILCHEGWILPQHLPEELGAKDESHVPSSGPSTLEEIEKRAIVEALSRNGWRKMKTCRELGISKDTLRRKLVSYGISYPLDGEGPD